MSAEPTPRERGLMLGHTFASEHESERARLKSIVRARTAGDVKAAAGPTVEEPAGLDHPVAFWSGFAHGVAAFLMEGAALLEPPPPAGG